MHEATSDGRRLGRSSEGLSITTATYERVDGTVSCIVTRFRLRSALSLPLFYLFFRRIRKQARCRVPGLIKAIFLVEGLRTCYMFSIWADDNAIRDFGTHVPTHVLAARWVFGRVFREDLHWPEIWSAQFRLWALSHNLNWDGVDLRKVLSNQLGKPPEDIARGILRGRGASR
jgi:hypothetical protein